MATNTRMNVGIRRSCGALGQRNFERTGTVLYKSNRENFNFLGTLYDIGVNIAFDVGGTHYSSAGIAALENAWNQGWILPVT